MPQNKQSFFRPIAAKGNRDGIYRIWYGSSENDPSPFVLTVTSQHLARVLRKAAPVTLEEFEEYVHKNHDQLQSIAWNAKAGGERFVVLR